MAGMIIRGAILFAVFVVLFTYLHYWNENCKQYDRVSIPFKEFKRRFENKSTGWRMWRYYVSFKKSYNGREFECYFNPFDYILYRLYKAKLDRIDNKAEACKLKEKLYSALDANEEKDDA